MSLPISALYFQVSSATNPLKVVEHEIFGGVNAFGALGVSVLGVGYLGATAGEILVRKYSSNVGDEDICKRISIAFGKGVGGGIGVCVGFYIAASLTANALEV